MLMILKNKQMKTHTNTGTIEQQPSIDQLNKKITSICNMKNFEILVCISTNFVLN